MKFSEGSIARKILTFDKPFSFGLYNLYCFLKRGGLALVPNFNDLAVVFFF
jgi:hypothetical protein